MIRGGVLMDDLWSYVDGHPQSTLCQSLLNTQSIGNEQSIAGLKVYFWLWEHFCDQV